RGRTPAAEGRPQGGLDGPAAPAPPVDVEEEVHWTNQTHRNWPRQLVRSGRTVLPMTTTTTATTTPPADAAEGWVPRIGLKERFPAAYRALAAVDATVSAARPLGPGLPHPVKPRASPPNGRPYRPRPPSRDLRDRGGPPPAPRRA